MTFFPSVPENAHLAHIFQSFRRGLDPILALHDDVMRGASDLSIGERELIGAYVSARNQCPFCVNAHRVYAEAFGIDNALFDQVVGNLDDAPVPPALKTLLRYVDRLVDQPNTLDQREVDKVLAAGWSENALHDTIMVVGIFSLMNRIILAHGVPSHDALYTGRLDEERATDPGVRQRRNEARLGAGDYAAFKAMVETGNVPGLDLPVPDDHETVTILNRS